MKILVAEDEGITRSLLTAMVVALGHQCLTAEDGEQAWDLYSRHSPDVVITDWMMPHLDGTELCRRVRSDPTARYTYIVLLTTLAAGDDLLVGMESGADDYLVKPLDPAHLKARLTAAERVTKVHAKLAASSSELERMNAELVHTARTDALTGVGNRRRFDEDIARLDARARRQGRPYGVALCDIDHFKSYNDWYGHQAGDQALQEVAGAIVDICREGDEVYRYGGEEFIMVFPDESLPGAILAAGRVRRGIEALAIPHQDAEIPGVVTISVGVSSLDPGHHDSHHDVVKEADRALYCAKDGGRNRLQSLGGNNRLELSSSTPSMGFPR
ncbi:MAG TPA: diguanylate cyclase [Acidimicrobiales bacterium]|nr:diguanylate cyclase [Acidimicrobiales bacterium]